MVLLSSVIKQSQTLTNPTFIEFDQLDGQSWQKWDVLQEIYCKKASCDEQQQQQNIRQLN